MLESVELTQNVMIVKRKLNVVLFILEDHLVEHGLGKHVQNHVLRVL